ncbi:hypothetical protein V8E54_007819 [Elaphomyces granulatus]
MEATVANARAVVALDRRLADRVTVDSRHSFARRYGHFTNALQRWTTVLVLDQGDHCLYFLGPFQSSGSIPSFSRSLWTYESHEVSRIRYWLLVKNLHNPITHPRLSRKPHNGKDLTKVRKRIKREGLRKRGILRIFEGKRLTLSWKDRIEIIQGRNLQRVFPSLIGS